MPLAHLCQILNVSRSGFYAWACRPPSAHAHRDQQLRVLIRASHEASRHTYGSPRIHRDLQDQGHQVSRKRVIRLKQAEGLAARVRRRFKRTTLSDHAQPVAANVLGQNFVAAAPNQRWVGDTTEFVIGRSGKFYLAAILDLYSRFVVGWAVSALNDRHLVIKALRMALKRREPAAGLLHHSDQGSLYATSGHLVYGTRGALWAAPFDLERLEVTGDSVRVVEGVQLKRNTIANFSLSLEGSLAYVAADAEQDLQRTLVWVDRQGHEESLDAPPRPYVSARAAPGGDRIALELADEGRDVWIWDLVRESLTRFTFDANGDDERPLWTPDGERVVFQSTRDGFFKIYWKAADGSGTVERLGVDDPASAQLPMAISSDGTRLVFAQAGQQRDLYMMTLDGEPVADPLLVTPFSEADADVSPNGRWLAYESDASGQAEIYVSSFPNIDGALLISRDGGFTPRWGPRGDELFYRGSQGLMRVPITWNPGPEPGASELLFSLADFCFYGCFSSTLYVAVE